jgi:hypothetical protein
MRDQRRRCRRWPISPASGNAVIERPEKGVREIQLKDERNHARKTRMVLKKIMILYDDGDVVKAAAPAAASEEE